MVKWALCNLLVEMFAGEAESPDVAAAAAAAATAVSAASTSAVSADVSTAVAASAAGLCCYSLSQPAAKMPQNCAGNTSCNPVLGLYKGPGTVIDSNQSWNQKHFQCFHQPACLQCLLTLTGYC